MHIVPDCTREVQLGSLRDSPTGQADITEKSARKYMVFFVNLNPDMGIIESLLTAISLCADCFAVSLCSSITIKNINWKNVGIVALSFAIIQALLLLV